MFRIVKLILLAALALSLALPAVAHAQGMTAAAAMPLEDGIVKVKSAYSVDETIARVKQDVAAKGIMFFMAVDQQKLAADAGIKLRPSTLLVFGNPPLGTLFIKANPVANPDDDDFEPDGTWYSMVAVRGDLYAVEPNHGEVDQVDPLTGAISRVVDVSATQGHIVPTALAYKGNFFLGNLGTFPVTPGTQTVFKLTPSGQLKPWATGLTTILGIAFDNRDRLYVLETSNHAGAPAPGNGDIVRIDPSGAQTTIVSGLTFPTGMTMGPDGDLWVSNQGFGPTVPGFGQILRIDPN